MIRGNRFRALRNSIGCLVLSAALVAAVGCSTANTNDGGVAVNHVDASGKSVSGWVAASGGTHAASAARDFLANGASSCAECHGSDLSGGIARVSCFTKTAGCHHSAGWVAVSPATQNHGVSAKQPPGNSGFASCKICHGNDFSGGGAKKSCYLCHTTAPHPAWPWLASAGSLYDHVTTDPGNAAICYACHAYTGSPNPRNPHAPPSPAPSGTPPGCFNGTMCHNQAGHPAGWVASSPAPQPHGVTAKKDNTVSGQGFAYCRTCHGDNFAGGTVNRSCFPCHGVNAPHPAWPWRASAGSTYTHTTTAEAGNAPVCYTCHAYTGSPNPRNPHAPPSPAPGGTPPGCFNGTMCHNEAGHAVPYNTTTHTSVTSGTFGAACGSCHDVNGTSTKPGPTCQTCHQAGSPLSAAGCTSCHAAPPAGGSYPNIGGAHPVHLGFNGVSCDSCHNGLGTGTLNHYNRANARPGKDALRVPPGDVAFIAAFNAKSGAGTFDNSASLRCTNVSCHGGQATPNWRTGAIDVNTQCTSCHAYGTTQYNSYNSGQHNRSQHSSQACTVCHNTTTLAANHFTNLGTQTMEGPASATIGGAGTQINSWNAGTKSCTPTCHGTETW